MEDILDKLRGLFEGGNFPNAQINILPSDGVHVSYEASKNREKEEPPIVKEPPSFDEMMQIFKKTHKEGYWSSNRCWGVGFQLWQIWGFEGTIKDYVEMVINSGEMGEFDYECNNDAVYKMMSKGNLSRHLENWRQDGVKEQYCILGEQINQELEKLFPHGVNDEEDDFDD